MALKGDSETGFWPLKNWLYVQNTPPHPCDGPPDRLRPDRREASDYKGYLPILNAYGPALKVLLVDKGYDTDLTEDDTEKRGGFAMIPMKKNRLDQIPVDGAIYALRNGVERCFNKLKNARHLATR